MGRRCYYFKPGYIPNQSLKIPYQLISHSSKHLLLLAIDPGLLIWTSWKTKTKHCSSPPPTHTHTHHDTRELQMWSLEQYHSSEIAFTKFGMIGSSKNFMLEHRAISIYNVQDSAIRKFDTPNSVRLPWPLDLFNYAFEWPWSLAYKLLVVIWQS